MNQRQAIRVDQALADLADAVTRGSDAPWLNRGDAMPRYHFDIRDHEGIHRDGDGIDCDDLEDARKQAQVVVSDIIREQVPDGDVHEIECYVRDGGDEIVYHVRLRLQGTMSPGGGSGVSDPTSTRS